MPKTIFPNKSIYTSVHLIGVCDAIHNTKETDNRRLDYSQVLNMRTKESCLYIDDHSITFCLEELSRDFLMSRSFEVSYLN